MKSTTAATTPPSTDAAFGWRFLTPLLVGSTLNPINSSMLATGLVGIGVDFHTGPGTTATLISVLYLCSAVMQPTMGKLSTLFGPRRVFQIGIVILLVGGVVGAAAPSFAFLLLSRALIGVGTSAAYPTAMSMVRRRADERGIGVPSRVIGNFSIAAQITMVFGLPIGGILTGVFGWRALFAVNIPLAVFAFIMTTVGIPADKPAHRSGGCSALRLVDIPGIALFAGMIVSLLIFVARLSTPVWWLLAVVAATGTALVVRERHATSPLIDVRMLAANRPLQRTYLRQLLVGLGIYTAMYGTSQWMEQSAGLSATAVGLVMLPLSGVSVIAARVISNRGWVRWPLLLAGIALVLTSITMALITHDSPIALLVLMTLLFGCANGFGGFANQATMYVHATASHIAVASGLYRTFSYVGAIFSSSVIGLAFGNEASDAGLHALAWVIAGIGVTVLVMSVLDRSIPVSVVGVEPEE